MERHGSAKKMSTEKSRRKSKRSARIMSITCAVSLVFCVHIEFRSSHRDKHTHIKNIQIQMLYEFGIQFNYWLNFKLTAATGACEWMSERVYACIDTPIVPFENGTSEMKISFESTWFERLCVFQNQSRKIFFMVFQQRTNDTNVEEHMNKSKAPNEWMNTRIKFQRI